MVITLLYYLMCACVAVLMVWNFLRTRDIYTEILYAFALMPFVLRLLRLK